MKKFEYKKISRIYGLDEKELNEEGSNGWELVSLNYQVTQYSVFHYIFKREIEEI